MITKQVFGSLPPESMQLLKVLIKQKLNKMILKFVILLETGPTICQVR